MKEFNVSREEYYDGTFEIAREGDFGYDASGYAVLVRDGIAAIAHISHCSCYGTWEQDGIPSAPWEWVGSVDELVELAKSNCDPDLPGFVLDSARDYGATYLLACYAKVVEWDRNGRK